MEKLEARCFHRFRALSAVGSDDTAEHLFPLVLETGKANLKCMALLDRANTETYGTPAPTSVPLTIEKGQFIGYPELKKQHPQLKGDFGTAWQNQQKEFADIPAPVLLLQTALCCFTCSLTK